MDNVVQLPATGSAKTRFTSENARQMAAKAIEAKRKRAEERKAEQERAASIPASPDDYASSLLSRVRALLAQNDEMLARASDPLDRDRLARAGASLAERERILAGRPLPGARKPAPDRPNRGGESIVPL